MDLSSAFKRPTSAAFKGDRRHIFLQAPRSSLVSGGLGPSVRETGAPPAPSQVQPKWTNLDMTFASAVRKKRLRFRGDLGRVKLPAPLPCWKIELTLKLLGKSKRDGPRLKAASRKNLAKESPTHCSLEATSQSVTGLSTATGTSFTPRCRPPGNCAFLLTRRSPGAFLGSFLESLQFFLGIGGAR